ncbi:transcription regulator AsnC [Yersinia kristensenii]|nr:transcription regulator AsnC [Yersinia kristensenii]
MLDKKDKELLRLLQRDCTLCLQDLAAAVDLTPNPCWKRIKRLEDEGIIIGGSVALMTTSQQKWRWRLFRQPEDKTVLPVTTRRRLDAEVALCVSCGLTQCLPISFVHAGMI